ncbi:MAG: hypothetical protein K6G22_09160 [Lachnospiraceae bacterium]|nr:hypothetical protein [Lachnospiraceae bacterium]
MKKISAIIITVLLAAVLAGFANNPKNTETDSNTAGKPKKVSESGDSSVTPAGKWILTEISTEDVTLDKAELKKRDLEVTLYLLSNGTGTVKMADESDSLTWDEENVYLDGSPSKIISLTKDELRLEDDAARMIFTRDSSDKNTKGDTKDTTKTDKKQNDKKNDTKNDTKTDKKQNDKKNDTKTDKKQSDKENDTKNTTKTDKTTTEKDKTDKKDKKQTEDTKKDSNVKTDKKKSDVKTSAVQDSSVQIRPTEAQEVKLETYKDPDGLFTMKIPSGWKVTTNTDEYSYVQYGITVTDKNHPERCIEVKLNYYGWIDQNVAADGPMYGGNDLWIPQATTEGFFEGWLSWRGEDFSLIENLGKADGGDLLHATVKDSLGKEREGLFSAVVFTVGEQIMFGRNLGQVWAENIRSISASPGEFTDWQPVLNESLASLQFSDQFWKLRTNEWNRVNQTAAQISQSFNNISDQVMSSWEKRQSSYDIRMQEQSDATLGYERIVDTKTGETYRAETGFLDGYQGTRYKNVESGSDLYNQAVSGYLYTP